ncbi:MAG: hypothetical protein F4037_10635 [Gemmatimonadales bacterium]|nr:hypothetical protein [Candidatus Palauibacter ramosifaciens]
MTEEAQARGEQGEFLRRVKRSLATVYGEVRDSAKHAGPDRHRFDVKVFTDNIVVAYPLLYPTSDLGEPELGDMLILFAQVQARLAADGFFLRGAITVGQHYQDQDIAYGEALLEAVDLDKSGDPPRLVIGSSLEPLIAEHLSWYGGEAPHHSSLLEDPRDERLFVNYLEVAYEDFPDAPVEHALLAAHQGHVLRGLRESESGSSVRAKYAWAATYHDYVCSTLAHQYQPHRGDGADFEYAAAAREAQKALDHLVPLKAEPHGQPPRPLDEQRLRGRLAAT